MKESRRFLSTAIASALDFEVMSPDEVFQHVTMEVLANELPTNLKARLVSAALEADAMDAMLILDTLGVDALAEHVPEHLLWACVADAATRSLAEAGSAPKPEATEPSISASEMPLSPVANAAPASKPRKPNRSARASRVRAGATSRSALPSPVPAPAPAPLPEAEESAFDVDTRVGVEPNLNDLDVIEETSYDASDEVTSHGHKP